ncbi:hypothetical protein [Streptomyces sp. NBC_00576]|uniref:hypothetical protein n=1 Tax=Streptomyces sp. NBC_00576 TaxID=2903665 RepID=UPI002E804676|nr:hypothetical protein [Streptomyces sp. NBC_00576]WUB72287.1 hypothetical protein OG734_20425 [Streptomyces sp. NBC_00576]
MSAAPESALAPESPYVSGRCTIGTHDKCRDAEPRESGVPGLRYLVCTCLCHRPMPVLVAGVCV